MWTSFKPVLWPAWIIAAGLSFFFSIGLAFKGTFGEGVLSFVWAFLVIFGIIALILWGVGSYYYKAKINVTEQKIKRGTKVYSLNEIVDVGVYLYGSTGTRPAFDLVFLFPNKKTTRIPVSLPFWNALTPQQLEILQKTVPLLTSLPEKPNPNPDVITDIMTREDLALLLEDIETKYYTKK